nr:hypothetical protein 13 [bacterium]
MKNVVKKIRELDTFLKNEGKGLKKLGNRFVKAINRGIGRDPAYIKKEADSEAYAIREKGKAITDKECYNKWEHARTDLAITALQYKESEAMRQQKNREQISCYAIEEYEKEISKNPDIKTQNDIDEDWLTSYWKKAQDVSREEMQKVWAKVLAQESINPEKFSLHTLQILENMSKREAEIFQKLSNISIDGDAIIVCGKNNWFESIGLRFIDILDIETLGLIQINLQFNQDAPLGQKLSIPMGKKELQISHPKKTKFAWEAIRYTNAGKELFSLIEELEDNELYISKLCTYLKKQGYHVEVKENVSETA